MLNRELLGGGNEDAFPIYELKDSPYESDTEYPDWRWQYPTDVLFPDGQIYTFLGFCSVNAGSRHFGLCFDRKLPLGFNVRITWTNPLTKKISIIEGANYIDTTDDYYDKRINFSDEKFEETFDKCAIITNNSINNPTYRIVSPSDWSPFYPSWRDYVGIICSVYLQFLQKCTWYS